MYWGKWHWGNMWFDLFEEFDPEVNPGQGLFEGFDLFEEFDLFDLFEGFDL